MIIIFCQHPNVLTFFGLTQLEGGASGGKWGIVTELMNMGSLEDILYVLGYLPITLFHASPFSLTSILPLMFSFLFFYYLFWKTKQQHRYGSEALDSRAIAAASRARDSRWPAPKVAPTLSLRGALKAKDLVHIARQAAAGVAFLHEKVSVSFYVFIRSYD